MSEDDRGGGEMNLRSDWEDRSFTAALRSGDGDKVARRAGVAGARISAGAARGLGVERVI